MGSHYGDDKFSVIVDTSLCPKQSIPALALNDLGIPVRHRYRTGEVCKVLQISPNLFRWRLTHQKYDGIEPGRDRKGRLFTIGQIRELARSSVGSSAGL